MLLNFNFREKNIKGKVAVADRRILAYISLDLSFLFKSRHTAEQIEEVVGEGRAV